MKYIRFALFHLILTSTSLSVLADEDVLMRALKDELQRSMDHLQLEGSTKPYFISYFVTENEEVSSFGTLGGMASINEFKSRTLVAHVRIGTPAFDNTNFFAFTNPGLSLSWMRASATQSLPLDNDYLNLRRGIWLATDAVYKQAVRAFSAKTASFVDKARDRRVPDFSKENPLEEEAVESMPIPALEPDRVRKLVVDLSKEFQNQPNVRRSRVAVMASIQKDRYVNSEGSSFTRVRPYLIVKSWAVAQARKGLELSDFTSHFGPTIDDLPKVATMSTEIGNMLDLLETRVDAEERKSIGRYEGPILFEGQAAAEYINQVIAPQLIASRIPDIDQPQAEPMLKSLENPYQTRIGKRVGSKFLSIFDDPTIDSYKGVPLTERYAVDDGGVRARRTLLIDKGLLKALLSGRNPIKGILQSTGNQQGVAVMPTNLVVESYGGLSEKQLKKRLVRLARKAGEDYGVIVRRISNPYEGISNSGLFNPTSMIMNGGSETSRLQPPIAAYKVFSNGDEELLGSTVFANLDASSFKEIDAVSKEITAHHLAFAPGARFMAFRFGKAVATITVATPSFLFKQMTLKEGATANARLPVTPPL